MDSPTFLSVHGTPELVEQLLGELGDGVLARRVVPGDVYTVEAAIVRDPDMWQFMERYDRLGWEQNIDPERVVGLLEVPFRPQPSAMAEDAAWRADAHELARAGLEGWGFEVSLLDDTDQMSIDATQDSSLGKAVGVVGFSVPDPLLDCVGVIRVDSVGILRVEPRTESWEGPWPRVR